MDYEKLTELVGEDNAITIYDWFASYTIDNLVQLVLDTYTVGQLLHLANQLNGDDDD
jgi:hypothetical protein